MKTLLLALSFTFAIQAQATTHLLMIGGGVRPTEAIATFVEAAGGLNAKILVCSWASATTEGAENIQKEIAAFHPQSVTVMPVFPMSSDNQAKLAQMLASATGVFFSGGNQNNLMLAMKSLDLKKVFLRAFANGVAFGGTSAGTAIMSERMITGDTTPPAEGLGLLPKSVIVDQHFIVRNRFNRLGNLVIKSEKTIGIGIDEGMALLVTDGRYAKPIGPSKVVLFNKKTPQSVAVEMFSEGQNFELAPQFRTKRESRLFR